MYKLIQSSQQTWEKGAIMIPILQRRKLRYTDRKTIENPYEVGGRTESEPRSLAPESMVSIIMCPQWRM